MTNKQSLIFVKYFPKSEANHFSITCALSQGAALGNDAHKNIILKKGDELVMFDHQVKMKDGWVVGVDVIPVPLNKINVMAVVHHVISDVRDVASAGSNVESAM